MKYSNVTSIRKLNIKKFKMPLQIYFGKKAEVKNYLCTIKLAIYDK